jgi:hypothetical protein
VVSISAHCCANAEYSSTDRDSRPDIRNLFERINPVCTLSGKVNDRIWESLSFLTNISTRNWHSKSYHPASLEHLPAECLLEIF